MSMRSDCRANYRNPGRTRGSSLPIIAETSDAFRRRKATTRKLFVLRSLGFRSFSSSSRLQYSRRSVKRLHRRAGPPALGRVRVCRSTLRGRTRSTAPSSRLAVPCFQTGRRRLDRHCGTAQEPCCPHALSRCWPCRPPGTSPIPAEGRARTRGSASGRGGPKTRKKTVTGARRTAPPRMYGQAIITLACSELLGQALDEDTDQVTSGKRSRQIGGADSGVRSSFSGGRTTSAVGATCRNRPTLISRLPCGSSWPCPLGPERQPQGAAESDPRRGRLYPPLLSAARDPAADQGKKRLPLPGQPRRDRVTLYDQHGPACVAVARRLRYSHGPQCDELVDAASRPTSATSGCSTERITIRRRCSSAAARTSCPLAARSSPTCCCPTSALMAYGNRVASSGRKATIYTTCMAVLALAVKYHYLPIYQR